MRLSVVMATRDRAETLGKTLSALAPLCAGRSDIEIIVADNGSSDETAAVLESFAGRLPLRTLYESRAGKNCALNSVLSAGDLGDVVIFTDDDIVPDQEWFAAITDACNARRDVEVFGGRVEILWDAGPKPAWAATATALGVVFSQHFLDQEGWYPVDKLPTGANFWVRRSVLDQGFRYNEAVGPRPTNRIMGSESTFLATLQAAGRSFWYVPDALVWHRVDPQYLKRSTALRRGFRLGRGVPHHKGIPRGAIAARTPTVWGLLQVLGCGKEVIRFLMACLAPTRPRRFEGQLKALVGLGVKYEAITLVRKNRREMRLPGHDAAGER